MISIRAGSNWPSNERVSGSVDCGTRGVPTLEGGQVPAPQLANPFIPIAVGGDA
jgi:hypothetical protein